MDLRQVVSAKGAVYSKSHLQQKLKGNRFESHNNYYGRPPAETCALFGGIIKKFPVKKVF